MRDDIITNCAEDLPAPAESQMSSLRSSYHMFPKNASTGGKFLADIQWQDPNVIPGLAAVKANLINIKFEGNHFPTLLSVARWLQDIFRMLQPF